MPHKEKQIASMAYQADRAAEPLSIPTCGTGEAGSALGGGGETAEADQQTTLSTAAFPVDVQVRKSAFPEQAEEEQFKENQPSLLAEMQAEEIIMMELTST